jgi:hypothetical protein
MRYFKLIEFTASATSRELDIDNTPSKEAIENIEALVSKVLDPLREAFGKPVYVKSGYRSVDLNMAVGGVKNSQHLKGEAADITANSREDNQWLFEYIRDNLPFDQLIDEYNYSWVHVSVKADGCNRRDIIHQR